MKIALSSVLNSHAVFSKMANEDFPIKTAFKITRIISELDPIVKDFNNKRMELFKKLGEVDSDNDDLLKIKKENEKEFSRQINDLLTCQIEIKDIDTIDISDIPDTFKLKPSEIASISFIKI